MTHKSFLPFALSLLTIALSSPILRAQTARKGSDSNSDEVTWPTTLTLGFGGGMNDAWNGASQYSPASPPTYIWTQSNTVISPEFHIMAEIPIAKNLMLAPRIAYNGYNMQFNNASTVPAGDTSKPLVLSIADIGADLLLKYEFSNFHVMGGVNLGIPIHTNYIYSTAGGPDTAVPNKTGFAAALKAGIGYDIPVNANNTIWITPEAFFTYSMTSYQTAHDGMSLTPVALTGSVTLKFALSSPPAPTPLTMPISATIIAHGVMPDGSRAPEPESPMQVTHTRSSMPLLPYVFFDENSAVIPSRYSQNGLMGFSEQSALDGKDALAANHEVMDVVGLRMKNNPSETVKLIGTNSNSKTERNNIELSKARATAVAEYLENSWGISPSRITIDQRNLPELPTNPVTKAGMQENRRVEIVSNDADLTAPVKLDDKGKSQSVGETEIGYDITMNPDPSVHKYANWTIALDKDGTPIGNTMSGTGAPPASTTAPIPNADNYLDQPIHYTLTVTDADGQTAHADGLTKIEAKTVDRNNYEKYSMLSFDFDRSEINARARQMLELIGESISGSATGVRIDGYCDSTGTREYNQTLSEARANSAELVLKSLTSLPANVTVTGHGIDDPKFPNDLPEGRQLNRRVEFTIEK